MTKQKKMEFAIVGVALLGILLIAVLPAKALDAKAAGELKAVAGGAAGVFIFSGARTTDIPNGILVWSSDGAEFWIRRSIPAGGLEAIPMKVPADASMVIPINAAYRSSGTWYQIIEVYCATDTVFCLPVSE